MAGDLPNRSRSTHLVAGVSSKQLSQDPELPATEDIQEVGHKEEPKVETAKEPSFFTRAFGPLRAPVDTKEETIGPLGLRCLFQATEPLVDLIFVHGLRGGSIKTWRLADDRELFWPQYWLPTEPEFANASIHSFGYDSDWGSTTRSILDVQDFGRSLYEELLTSPSLRRNAKDSPIILIGHSMGGLVIKKAYILAQESGSQNELSQRLRCMFFLATPHRGSDYAALLNNILKYCGVTGLTSSRDYIRDIETGSTLTQLINNDFARHAEDLTIYSFCETLPTISGSSKLIVSKKSAILGLHPKNEHIQYLRANHRDICKYRSRHDSNFIILKNSLATAVENLIRNASAKNSQASIDQMRNIQDLLQIRYVPEEYHDKLEGSCKWVEEREDYRSWMGGTGSVKTIQTHRPSILWIQAHPGAGKTVLATHIIARLSHSRSRHASYFFHFGKQTSQSLTGLMRSLAFQMASSDTGIREKLVEIHGSGIAFDQDDGRAIWHKIFLAGIFQVASSTPHFWVIDGLDECAKHPDLITYFKDIQSHFPLRILLTSRRLAGMPRLLRTLEGCEVALVNIPASDTKRDIEMYVSSRIDDLPLDEEAERKELARQILAKSKNSFLWVRLVMDELEGLYGYDSIIHVLQGIPEGMAPYYARVVTEMGEKTKEQHIAKAVLKWVMLATRPLSVSELSHALQLDINAHLPSAKAAVEGLCGHLVTVDVHTSLILPVHATAREFILSEEANEFRVVKVQGHQNIALTCLRLLVGPQMQPPRHRRLLSQRKAGQSISALMDYATTQYSEHVVLSSTESSDVLVALVEFLKTTILTWIENLMLKTEMDCLVRTAKNLKAYLNSRTRNCEPLNHHIRIIDAWATDLIRIVSSFGRALIRNPQSIHFLIPPLCPRQSAIFQQFGSNTDGLSVSGYRRSNWSDCVAHIHLENERAAAIACGNSLIAIGMESGKLEMYSSRNFQKEKPIDINSPVDIIYFDPLGTFVAVSGRRSIGIWDVDGTVRWKIKVRERCITMASSQDILIGMTAQGRSYQWDVNTGQLIHEQVYTYQTPIGDVSSARRAPSAACFSPGLELVALNYRNKPVSIFECNTGIHIGWAIDGHKRAAEQIVFNPNPEVCLLLVAYNESHLALYEPWTGALVESAEAESHAILTAVTCSPDGRSFATIDVGGYLRVYDFKSLTLLYQILTPAYSFGCLQFTSDNLGIVHVDRLQMKVWAPSALVRRTMEEEASLSDEHPIRPVIEGHSERFQTSKIETLIAHPSWPILFAGNHNGDVLMYQASRGNVPTTLYSHNGVFVRHLASSKHNVIASADRYANVQVWQFDPSQSQGLHTKDLLLQLKFSRQVRQLLLDDSGKYLLISTADSAYVYRIQDESCIGSQNYQENERWTWKWFIVSSTDYADEFLLLDDNKVTAYKIEDFSSQGIIVAEDGGIPADASIESVTHLPGTRCIVVETQQSSTHNSSLVFTLPTRKPSEHHSITSLTKIISPELCVHFLGFDQASKRIILLQPDSWVCSVDLEEIGAAKYVEHFFVPEEFGSLNSEVRPVQTAEGDFAFCMYDKVVVIHGGLKFETQRLLGDKRI